MVDLEIGKLGTTLGGLLFAASQGLSREACGFLEGEASRKYLRVQERRHLEHGRKWSILEGFAYRVRRERKGL